jgi:acyl-CoA dehydrogenase
VELPARASPDPVGPARPARQLPEPTRRIRPENCRLPAGGSVSSPKRRLGAQVARALLEDREERLRITRDIYIPPTSEPGLGRLEAALDRAVEALAVETKIRDAVRAGRLDHAPGDALADLALSAGVITHEERRLMRAADEARDEVIRVDAFDPAAYRSLAR